jgi:hypothetical protein
VGRATLTLGNDLVECRVAENEIAHLLPSLMIDIYEKFWAVKRHKANGNLGNDELGRKFRCRVLLNLFACLCINLIPPASFSIFRVCLYFIASLHLLNDGTLIEACV